MHNFQLHNFQNSVFLKQLTINQVWLFLCLIVRQPWPRLSRLLRRCHISSFFQWFEQVWIRDSRVCGWTNIWHNRSSVGGAENGDLPVSLVNTGKIPCFTSHGSCPPRDQVFTYSSMALLNIYAPREDIRSPQFLPGWPQSWSCCGRWPSTKQWGGVGERSRTMVTVEWEEACGQRRSDSSAGTAAAGTPLGWWGGGNWTRGWAQGERKTVIKLISWLECCLLDNVQIKPQQKQFHPLHSN